MGSENLTSATEDVQCHAIHLLSRIPCMVDKEGGNDELHEIANQNSCAVCDGPGPRTQALSSDGKLKKAVCSVFSKMIRLDGFLKSRRPRIVAMIALRRIILHCDDFSEFLNFETSEAAQWCLQSLNSSVRELRISAGRTLAIFLQGSRTKPSSENLLCRNSTNAIAFLRSISENGEPQMIETCVMAWGQLGRVVVDEELNLVLIKLLEYLGSSNTMVSSFAFNELLNLAEALETTPRRLFEPFWRSLAYLATKDMIHRPQRSRAIAELLQISVSDLLLLIQTHALPWLVLDKRVDVIRKFSEARQENDIWRPLMDSSNFAAIVSLLLLQETEDPEEFTKARLDNISPHFHNLSLSYLLQSEPVLIAMELLKAAADGGEERQALVGITSIFQDVLLF